MLNLTFLSFSDGNAKCFDLFVVFAGKMCKTQSRFVPFLCIDVVTLKSETDVTLGINFTENKCSYVLSTTIKHNKK